MTRWEYLSVTWKETRTEITHSAGVPSDWKWERTVKVFWPGDDEGEVVGKSIHTWIGANKAGDFEVIEEGVKTNALLNRLGAEGWEVVTSSIQSTAVSMEQGYPAAGRPIATSFLLKRPID
jgi:hypothetical protein